MMIKKIDIIKYGKKFFKIVRSAVNDGNGELKKLDYSIVTYLQTKYLKYIQ